MSNAIYNLSKEELIEKCLEQEKILCSIEDPSSVKRQFAETQQMANIGSWELDMSSGKVQWSDQMYVLMGYTPNQVEPSSEIARKHVHNDDIDYYEDKIKQSIETGEPFNFENRVITADQKVIWVRSSGKTKYDDDHNPVYMSGTVQDISEQKFTEILLKKSEQKYSSFVEQANEGIIIVQDWKIKYCNQYFYNCLEYTYDEILELPIEQIFSNTENSELIKNRYDKRLKGEQIPNIYEAEAITKNGKIIPIEINASVMEYEGQPAIQVIIRDISDRKAVEDDRKQIQKELDLIYNSTSDIISLIQVEEDDLKLVSFNNSFWESVREINPDLTKTDLLNSSVYDSDNLLFWPESFMVKMINNYKKVLETLEPLETHEIIPFGPVTKYFIIKHTPIFNDKGNCSHILLVVQDISEKKNIQTRNELLANIIESSPIAFIITDLEGKIIDVNPAFEKLTFYKKEELLGLNPGILNAEKNADEVQNDIFTTLAKNKMWFGEIVNKKKNGELFDNECSIFPLTNEKNEITAYVSFNQDITERKNVERSFFQSKQRFESLFNNSPVPLWEEDFKELNEYLDDLREKGIKDFREYFEENINEVIKCSQLVKVESVNNATIVLHRAKNQEELLGNLEKLFTENSLLVFREEIIAIADGENSFECEAEVKTLTGEILTVFLKLTVQENNKALLATIDITERQKAELALAKSEQSLLTLMNNIPGMAYQCLDDDDWTMTFVNRECLNLIGFEPDQIINNKEFSYNDLIHPDDREYVRIKVEEKLGSGEPFEIEYRIIDAGGKEKWVWERGTKVKEKVDGQNILEGVIHDITDKKLADKAFNELAQLNNQILNATMDGYILADTNGIILEVNPSYCEMIGYSQTELMEMNIRELEVISDSEQIKKRIEQMLTTGGINFRTKHKHKDGYLIDLDVSITVIKRGDESFIAALVRDITEQIKAAEKLKESEERYRTLVDNQTDLVVEVDSENKFKFVSPSYCSLFGKSEAELLGNSFFPLIHEDDRLATEKEMEKLFTEPFTCKVEQRAMTVNGWKWLEWYDKAIYDDDDNLISIFGVGRDITEKKEAEIKIKESEERFKQLFNNMGSGVAIYNAIDEGNDFILEDINKAGQALSNVRKDEEIGKKLTESFPRVTEMGLLEVFKKVYTTDEPSEHPIILYKDSMIERYFENYVYKLPTGQMVAIYNDTSRERKALEALKKNEEDLRAILNTSFDAIVLIQKNGTILEANKVFCNLVNKHREEILDKSLFNFTMFKTTEKHKKHLTEILLTKSHVNYIDESYGRIWDFSMYPILDRNGEVDRLTIFAKDITEKSIFEEKLKETNEKLRNLARYINDVREEERKNVAREVHDNLGQKLTALNLDISWIKQSVPDEISHIKDQFDPVLALINESIITVQKISTELRPGILDDLGLVNAIQWQSNEISRRSNLKFSLNLYKNEIDLGDAVKTALFRVYQEALTNIVRHADASTVSVNLIINEKKLIFEVIDDGKGILVADINNVRSYGIIGMKERIESINGKITFTNLEQGTKLQITIPI